MARLVSRIELYIGMVTPLWFSTLIFSFDFANSLCCSDQMSFTQFLLLLSSDIWAAIWIDQVKTSATLLFANTISALQCVEQISRLDYSLSFEKLISWLFRRLRLFEFHQQHQFQPFKRGVELSGFRDGGSGHKFLGGWASNWVWQQSNIYQQQKSTPFCFVIRFVKEANKTSPEISDALIEMFELRQFENFWVAGLQIR